MDELDNIMAEARDVPVPERLMGRVLEDALAAQPVRGTAPLSVWARLREALGGWQGLGGLAAATCAGVWIGLSPPDYLPGAALDLLGAVDVGAVEDGGFGWAVIAAEDAL